jgi:FkbM family methyltransferase|tara:strand:- start:2993 stop:3667 length:675 start_codon:yes stop_codon:yes gene_type:complete
MEVSLTKCKTDKYSVYVIDDDEFVGAQIRTTGKLWEEWISGEVKKYYKEGTDILDIGANIGTHTLLFSEIGPVHSFEPLYHAVVTQNVKSNSLKNPVKVYPYALSDEAQMRNMYLPRRMPHGLKNYGGSSMHLNETAAHSSTPVPVECKTLDEVYNGVPSVIKMDVENHEPYVLRGAINTIKTHKPAIIIEISNYETSEVPKILQSFGYTNYTTPDNSNYIYTT